MVETFMFAFFKRLLVSLLLAAGFIHASPSVIPAQPPSDTPALTLLAKPEQSSSSTAALPSNTVSPSSAVTSSPRPRTSVPTPLSLGPTATPSSTSDPNAWASDPAEVQRRWEEQVRKNQEEYLRQLQIEREQLEIAKLKTTPAPTPLIDPTPVPTPAATPAARSVKAIKGDELNRVDLFVDGGVFIIDTFAVFNGCSGNETPLDYDRYCNISGAALFDFSQSQWVFVREKSWPYGDVPGTWKTWSSIRPDGGREWWYIEIQAGAWKQIVVPSRHMIGTITGHWKDNGEVLTLDTTAYCGKINYPIGNCL
jgi:hypothetical protein